MSQYYYVIVQSETKLWSAVRNISILFIVTYIPYFNCRCTNFVVILCDIFILFLNILQLNRFYVNAFHNFIFLLWFDFYLQLFSKRSCHIFTFSIERLILRKIWSNSRNVAHESWLLMTKLQKFDVPQRE